MISTVFAQCTCELKIEKGDKNKASTVHGTKGLSSWRCNCSSKSIGRKVTQAEELSAFCHICTECNVIEFMI